jgi:hypothetical protein
MFGISKFDVAQMFERVTLDAVRESCESRNGGKLTPLALYHMARICAEDDDYHAALTYCKEADIVANHPSLVRYAQSLTKYYEENGTTRLWID